VHEQTHAEQEEIGAKLHLTAGISGLSSTLQFILNYLTLTHKSLN
jgi:hypothetical protein